MAGKGVSGVALAGVALGVGLVSLGGIALGALATGEDVSTFIRRLKVDPDDDDDKTESQGLPDDARRARRSRISVKSCQSHFNRPESQPPRLNDSTLGECTG